MKKVLTIILGGFLLALVVIFLTQKPKNPISPATRVINNTPTIVASSTIKLKTYTNPSGFSFQYPKSLLLTEKKVTDQSIYAWVELTDPQKKGVIIIKLESSDLTKIDDRVTARKIKKIKLADLDGREFIDGNLITTLALDQGGVLITITTDSLLPTYQQIVSSFIFTQPTQAVSNTTGDEGDIVFEGEEVVE
ncbi:conserved hypothetical protein [Candidatus Roizmanbacteria bacterium]|nr:conserved hypothetical protein [Candidatus Roizmanbacteria bacterium]